MTKKKLTLKEKRFVQEYLKTGNQAGSIVKAGYQLGSKGGNPINKLKIASQMGKNKLDKVEIKESIEEQLIEEGIDRKEIISRFKDLLYSNDLRVVKEMIDMWSKWVGAYSPERKMIMSRSEIYQEIKEMPEHEEQPLLESKEEVQELPEG